MSRRRLVAAIGIALVVYVVLVGTWIYAVTS